jgi:NADH-quinone oxidoreductase subunit L
MGGLWNRIPITYALMWIGSLSLAGIPIFAGYYSKDMILSASWAAGTAVGRYSFCLGIFTAFLTAFYSWRLLIMTFHGQPRADEETLHHVHESPWVMLVPLIALSVGAIFAGVIFAPYFVGHANAEFWRGAIVNGPANHVLEHAHESPLWVKWLPLIASVIGLLVAAYMYLWKQGIGAKLAAKQGPVYLFLYNKWFFDEIYQATFVRLAKILGDVFWKIGDKKIIDGLGPDGVAWLSGKLGKFTGRLQTGYVYHYAFVMLLGVLGLISYALWSWGA